MEPDVTFIKDDCVNKKYRMRWRAGVSGLMCLFPVHAENPPNAEVTVAEYEAEPLLDRTKFYLHGVEAGLRYALAINKMNRLPVIYCQPEQLALSSKDLVMLVDNEIAISPDLAVDKDVPVAVVLLRALQRAYPSAPR
jgi:hypothetical protein